MADTPFNMSFDELVAQANANKAAQSAPTQAAATSTVQPASQPNPAPIPAPTGPVPTGMSFDALVAQAQANASNLPMNEPIDANPASEPAPAPVAEEPAPAAATRALSFDEMVEQAKKACNATYGAPETAAPTETAANETPANSQAESTPTETAANETPANSQAESTPVVEQAVNETPANSQAEPAPAESDVKEQNTTDDEAEPAPAETEAATEPKAAAKSKGGRGKRSKKQEAEKAGTEAPEDITDNYRVDILGTANTGNADTSMEHLFTPEEVAALRASIRTFVRNELKLAMVDAMKELVNDFSR